jgi:peptidoglycan/xylan/chitin deacetylase (PgdA/CDA1 family)/SAM-dependent methyltransferase
MNLASDRWPGNGTLSPMLTPEYWEEVFAEEDPWDYGNSAYESWKFDQTLALLPAQRFARALELGCAEGHLTSRLAPLVGELVAVDISPTAVERARRRCAGLANVQSRVLNLATDALPTKLDLVVCSEMLFYLPLSVLHEVAPKMAASLKSGGYLLLAHGNLIADDKTRTGFDWDHPFGAKTIGEVFGALPQLALVKELRTPLYTVQLYRAIAGARTKKAEPQVTEIPLPPDLVLTPEVEKSIVWNGAVTTRAEAWASESAAAVPILMYHSVADDGPPELAPYRVSPAAFREQLRYLRRHGYYSISLEEWSACIASRRPPPGRAVILTFDDGYKNFIENAWPLLERTDFKATLFVVTEKVGRVADWDAGAAEPLPLMSWEDLKELHRSGVEIGSHSASHQDFSAISPYGVMAEGQRARARLRDELGTEANIIAFPWGRGDDAVQEVLARCGYRIGLTTWGGHSTLADNPMNLPRIEIFGDDDVATFARKLEYNAAPSVATVARRNADLVDDSPPEVGFVTAGPPPDPAASGSSTSALSDVRGTVAVAATAPAMGSPTALRSALTAAAEIVGFDIAPARGIDRSIHPDYLLSLSARLDVLIGEFVKLQTQLLNCLSAPVSLQRQLTMLFAQPVTGKVNRVAVPGEEISPGIVLGFEEDTRVALTIEPKNDHSLSPDSYLNTVGLALTGASEWLELQAALQWSDLSLARHYQLCLCARLSRSVSCEAMLRLPRKAGEPLDLSFAHFELNSEAPNAVLSGDLHLPDFIELDTSRQPTLILYFGTQRELSLVLHYLNVYFA